MEHFLLPDVTRNNIFCFYYKSVWGSQFNLKVDTAGSTAARTVK